MRTRAETSPKRVTQSTWRFLALVIGALLALAAIVFRGFLFGDGLLLYKDGGSDSINDYYSSFVHLSDYLRLEGFPSWSFCLGMGQDLYYLAGYLVLEPVSWLPRQLIAHGLIFQHLAKLSLAGLFFFGFLELRGLNMAAALLGSFLVAFSGYMCMGACWYPFSDEVVCFTAILFFLELALRRGSWHLLAWPIGAVAFIDAFHLYLCALFLVLYVPARLFLQYGWQPRVIFRAAMWLGLAALVGVGLSAFYSLPNLYFAFNSPRGSGSSSMINPLASVPIFKLESQLHYLTAAVRMLGNDLLGTAEDFRGWQNYLEAPLTYCGLLCVVLLPQAFVGATLREKVVRGLFLGAILITTVLPWTRYLFWAFQGDYYRALSLFSVLGIVSLSVVAFASYSDNKPISRLLLLATAAAAIGFLYSPLPELQARLASDLKHQTTVFLVIYPVLLVVGDLLKQRRPAALVVILITVSELALSAHRTVAERKFVTKEELALRSGYNDATIDALHDIKTEDNSPFYRITKIRSSSPAVLPSLNDALIFGYYGTSYYSSFNNLNYIRFLIAADAIPPNSEIDTRYSVGLLNDSTLSLFAAEKYVLTHQPIRWQRGLQYELVRQYGQDYLFRNARFVPLGLTFHQYISEDAFRGLDSETKAAALLWSVVLPDATAAETLGLSPIAIPDLEQEIRMSSLTDVAEARRKTGLELTAFRQARIEGNVTLDHKGVLVVQTPFDRGWEALQDGKVAPTVKVDVGLLGVGLDNGHHKVELQYRTPFLRLGAFIGVGSLLILLAAAWRWPRINLTGAAL